MPVGLLKRLAMLALLLGVFLGYFALFTNQLLFDLIPALATLSVLWILGVATYPMETSSGRDWGPAVMVSCTGLGSLATVYAICLTAGRYAEPMDCSGLTLLGIGLVGASASKRMSPLLDERATGLMSAKENRTAAA